MNREQVIQDESRYMVQTYRRPEIVLERGQGMYLYDTEGNEYLDFTSGIAVAALGHSDPEWAAAIAEQSLKLAHVSNLYYTEPQVGLARRLVEHSFADRVFFSNSGAEANDGAIKFARKFARSQGHTDKHEIVAFSGSFHGRTLGAVSMTYKPQYREPFGPLLPGVLFAPFNDSAAARQLITDQTCAVFVEPVLGEGGVLPATAEFLMALREACDEHGALLVFDEVQCGLGRTGRLWAYEGYGVVPDMMTLAKPLANGLPIGAILVMDKVAAVLQPGDHGSTFAGGPLVCRAAEVVFDRIAQPAFLQQVTENGERLVGMLSDLASDHIVDVRGAGLLVGIELDTAVVPVIAAARERGLLIINAGENIIRLAPPLIVEASQIDTAVGIISQSLQVLDNV